MRARRGGGINGAPRVVPSRRVPRHLPHGWHRSSGDEQYISRTFLGAAVIASGPAAHTDFSKGGPRTLSKDTAWYYAAGRSCSIFPAFLERRGAGGLARGLCGWQSSSDLRWRPAVSRHQSFYRIQNRFGLQPGPHISKQVCSGSIKGWRRFSPLCCCSVRDSFRHPGCWDFGRFRNFDAPLS